MPEETDFYYLIHDANGDRCVEFHGMTQEEAEQNARVPGYPVEKITKEQYDTFNKKP